MPLELIVGMSVDAAFGPLLMFGAGGTAVEVLRDTAHALPPLDTLLAQDLMRQTRVFSLLQGYRDRPAADIEAIADVLVRLSYLVAHHPAIREIDINPLLADERGVIALDARVAVVDPQVSPRMPLAIRPYPSEWVDDLAMQGVGPVRIRPIRPEDEALYEKFFSQVTAEDRRLRFFGAGPNLSHGFLARLTQIDYAREMAFVAIHKGSNALLGVVRLIADPDYVRAEYAILVRSDLKGRGLGSNLMQHLLKYAKVGTIAGTARLGSGQQYHHAADVPRARLRRRGRARRSGSTPRAAEFAGKVTTYARHGVAASRNSTAR